MFPASANYVALGHLHRAQQMPGAAPIWYSGSPIQVDFGEERDTKQVLLVDIPERGAAKVNPDPAHARRGTSNGAGHDRRTRSSGTDDGDAFLRVFVRERPRAGLADDVRALLPNAVDVRIAPDLDDTPSEARARVSSGASPRELFAGYLEHEGREIDPPLLALFDELLDEETV